MIRLAAVVAWLAMSANCHATLMILNGTTILNGQTESISGSFGYNPAANVTSARFIQFTGPAPYAGNYFLADEQPAGSLSASKNGFVNFSAPWIEISFSSSFPFDVSAISQITWNSLLPITSVATDTAPSAMACSTDLAHVCFAQAAADPPFDVPEPSSLVIMGTALAFLSFTKAFVSKE